MKFTIGTKKEMTQVFDEKGNITPVTIVDVADVKVVGMRTKEKHGYNAIILGKGTKKNTTKAERENYKEVGHVPAKVVEFRVDELPAEMKVGDDCNLDVDAQKYVNVVGMTKGKGFAGVVKRWGFHGGPKTHGQSDRHRAPGSIGSGTTPGRVYKGKRMAGRMGQDRKLVKNLKLVLKLDDEKLIAVKGAVPGAKNGYVLIQSTYEGK